MYVSQRYQDEKYCIWYGVDQLAFKYPNMSSYVYCAANPVKYVDPDGRVIQTWEIAMKGRTGVDVYSRNSLSANASRAFLNLNKTSGISFFGMFAQNGDRVGNLLFTNNGKYSDITLNIFDVSYSKEQNLGGLGTTATGYIELEIIDGKPVVNLALFTRGQDINSILEDIVHESQLHGYGTVLEEIEIFKKGGVEALNKYRSMKNSEDHIAIRDKDESHKGYSMYKKVCEQLAKKIKSFTATIKEASEKYMENYKALKKTSK